MSEGKTIIIRTIQPTDREAAIEVETQATPGLSYVPHVFDQFRTDPKGEFLVGIVDGEMAGIGKFSQLPDGTAWLETLRVKPRFQGLGIGKLFYQRFCEIAEEKRIPSMGMYTGVNNAVSKGLAERFGLRVRAEYAGVLVDHDAKTQENLSAPDFKLISDPAQAAELILPLKTKWKGFLILNRTFHPINQDLCKWLTEQEMVFHDQNSGSLAVLGARFMPWQALHIGMLDGDLQGCLNFAKELAAQRNIPRLNCLYAPEAEEITSAFEQDGWQKENSHFIVMRVELQDGKALRL